MKFNKKLKKGFTLVELIVVIAIVAILAAVSVVSYVAFINQANLSADQQMVTQMNKIVQADKILNEYEYPSDAVTALYANGFNDGKLKTYSSGYHYAYSMENNKWYLLDNNHGVIYPESVTVSTLWGLYDNGRNDKINGVYKYIAINGVLDQSPFYNTIDGSGAFNETYNYEIDLFHNIFSISSLKEDSTVKLFNGTVVESPAEGITEDSSIKTSTAYTAAVSSATLNVYVEKVQNVSTTIKGLSFDSNSLPTSTTTSTPSSSAFYSNLGITNQNVSNMEIYFEDCVFSGSTIMQLCYTVGNVKKLSFKNCSLLGSHAGHIAALDCVSGNDNNKIAEYVFDGCFLKNTAENGRGLNIASNQDAENRFTFINNTFLIQNANNNGMAIQMAGKYTINESSMLPGSIVIKDNYFMNAYAAIRCNGIEGLNMNMFSVSGNTFGQDVRKTCTKDGNASDEAYATAIAALF